MSKKIKISIPNKERPNLHSLFHAYIDRRSKECRSSRSYDSMYDDYDFESLAAMGLLSDMGFYPDEDFDEGEIIFPYNSSRKKKHGKLSDDDAYSRYWAREEMKRNARRAARQSKMIEDAEYVEIKGKKKRHRNKGKKHDYFDITKPYSGWEDNPTEINEMEMRKDYSLDTPRVTIWFYPSYCNQDDRLEFNNLKDFDDFCCDEGYVVPPYIAEDLAYRSVSHACLRPEARERGVFEIYAAETYNEMAYEVCNVEELSQ